VGVISLSPWRKRSLPSYRPAAINAGYFAAGSGPLSYAKGHTGYESPSGNVKGPRACLVYDRTIRKARVELSMGRKLEGAGWGDSLYPTVSDVACGGPWLLKNGARIPLRHRTSDPGAYCPWFGPLSPGQPRAAAPACWCHKLPRTYRG
jgi:hypothetical protein